MLRTIFWGLWLFGYLLYRLPAYWRVKRMGAKGDKQGQMKEARRTANQWAKTLMKYVGITLEVHGLENLPKEGETVVFASNHQSYLDIPVLLGGLDTAYPLLARKEIGKVPLLRGWMNLIGCIYIDREDARAAMGALRQAEEMVNEGSSLIVFPEGTRSKSDKVGEFKGGVVRVAFKTGVDIVPLVIDGSYKVLEGNRWRLKRAHVRLFILPAVPTQGLSRAQQKELPGQLEEMVRQAKAVPQIKE